jgi:hypothetical protein
MRDNGINEDFEKVSFGNGKVESSIFVNESGSLVFGEMK